MAGPAFRAALSKLTGIENLLPDLIGGGMHLIPQGGHLGIHADFNRHVGHYRRINVLLFLNSKWDAAWGGDLELWDGEKGPARKIVPAANRLAIFTTSDHSFHGHPYPLKCPPDRARKSLAMYFFTKEEPEWASADHSTLFIDHTKAGVK